MCGIVGLSLAAPAPEAGRLVEAMRDRLRHRGPDDEGLYVSPSGRTWLGFRRLAIRDLQPRANQPMLSASGRTALAFNGEIYNHDDLAARHCADRALRTSGDSEVLLEVLERRGSEALADCNGMFALGLLDVASDRLLLIRDRMGQKPLYVYEGEGWLAFASELRALRGFGLEPDPEQAAWFLHFGYFPAPHTFYRRTRQLLPGEIVEARHGRIAARRRYFRASDLPWGTTDRCDLAGLDHLLADAVSIRTRSDVPLGAFLSGGVDSSLVASQLARRGHTAVPTFTVAFRDPQLDEAPFAADVARRLGLPHRTIPIDEARLPDLLDDYVDCYEQPFADTSGIPTMLLCQAVREDVTVALSGDGGDEFFGGYARYGWYRQALRAQRMPAMARRLLGRLAPRVDRQRGARIERLLETRDDAGLYADLVRVWSGCELSRLMPDLPAAAAAPPRLVRDLFARVPGDPLIGAACFDASYYLPDNLQVKLDRASMRVALEVRSPLLDHRLAAAGAALATGPKYRRGPKRVFHDLLARHLPPSAFRRSKQGFRVPLARWLAGPLRLRLRDAIVGGTLRECGWLDCRQAERTWRRFDAGRHEFAYSVWLLLVLACQLESHRRCLLFPERTLLERRRAA